MTTIFQKSADDDGNETYVEVDLNTLELPEDHPQLQKATQIINDRTERKNKANERIKKLESELKTLRTAEKDEEPADEPPDVPTKPEPTAAAVDPAEIAKLVRQQLLEEQSEQAKVAASRKQAVDAILKESGLSDTYRPIIDAIPDLEQAKEQASFLAKTVSVFDQTPGGGNGQRDTANLLKGVNKRLGLED